MATISSCHFTFAASSSASSQIAHEPPYEFASIDRAMSGLGWSRSLGPVLWQNAITDFAEGASMNLSRNAISISEGLAREHWFSQRLRWPSGHDCPAAIDSSSKLEGTLSLLPRALFITEPAS